MMLSIEVSHGDITQQRVDAIVNAANQRLLGGAGVDGAIHQAGGPQIMAQCDLIREQQGGCPTGQAVITTAGNLPAKYVIHTVGPIWHGGNDREAQLLKDCYLNSLKLAVSYNLTTIAFPNISTGVYGYPKELAAELAVKTVRKFSTDAALIIDRIVFVCFDDENYSLYKQLI